MIRSMRLIFGLVIALFASSVTAQAVKLTGDEIRELLTGNTALGRWEGGKYRQFFGEDGSTIYAQDGSRSTLGEWRVDDAAQEYQSIWQRDAEWEGWFVMDYGNTFYWVSKRTPPTPFSVVPGQQLVAE